MEEHAYTLRGLNIIMKSFLSCKSSTQTALNNCPELCLYISKMLAAKLAQADADMHVAGTSGVSDVWFKQARETAKLGFQAVKALGGCDDQDRLEQLTYCSQSLLDLFEIVEQHYQGKLEDFIGRLGEFLRL